MAYEERGIEHSRVVVNTPNSRREVSRTETEYAPAPRGVSSATIAAIVVLTVAVLGLLGLLFWNTQMNQNQNQQVAAQQPPPPAIAQQPAPQAPVIVRQPATQPAPVVVNPPANQPAVPNDSSIQAAVDKRLRNDPDFAALPVTASVSDGKVLLVGTVNSQQLKARVERAVRSVKGVLGVDNQLTISNR